MQEKYVSEAEIFWQGDGATEENRGGKSDCRVKTEGKSLDSDSRPPKSGGRDNVARVSAQDEIPLA